MKQMKPCCAILVFCLKEEAQSALPFTDNFIIDKAGEIL